MTKSVGLTDYDFTEKEKWRVWTWNQIAKRLKKPTKDAVGLYFAGAQDLDRPVALRKGFSPNNLIAVERDPKSVKILRKKKVNVIDGDLVAAIRYWSNSPPQIDFINADFTCGITLNTLAFLSSIFGCDGLANPIVVCVNLLRGRDKQLNEITDAIYEKGSIGNMLLRGFLSKKEQNRIHRGKKYACAGLLWISSHRSYAMRAREKNCGNINQEVVQHQISYMKSLKLSFYSYKSPKGKCYMDACAFTANRTGFYCNSEKFNEIACKMQVTPVSEADNCKMKVAAAKAVRTMRIEGTLPTYGSRLGWKEI